jgi:single-strand DNA-binding protein
MGLPILTGEFTVVADPELKFSQDGKARARVRLVANSRKQVGGEWQNDKTLWRAGTAFGKVAENIAESVTKGSRVIVTGRLETSEWEKDGEKKSATSLIIDKFGLDLMFDPAHHQKAERQQSSGTNNPWGSDDAAPF